LRVAIATLLGGTMIAEPAFADDATQQYKIPAQSLNNALMKFAADSNLELIFSADTVRSLNAKSLDGSMTPEQALGQLLQGSGYTCRFIDKHTVTLEKAPEQLNKTDPNTLKPVTVIGASRKNDAFNAPEDNIHYNLRNASSATKTDTPILETPQSIQVVPRALMNDQQVFSIEDALKNITGVAQNLNNTYSNPYLRGFIGDSSYFRNGLRQGSQPMVETAQLSSIEVVKGPMSGLYGRIQAGGLVDMITNRPQEEAHYSLQQQVGSFDTYRTVLDGTGPLMADKSLLYRLNFVYKNNGLFRDYVDNADHIFVMPSITWRPNEKFDVNANMEYSHDNYVADQGIIYSNAKGVPFNTPISTFFGDGVASQANPINLDKWVGAYDWNYRFNADWKLTNRFAYTKIDYQQSTIYQTALSADGKTFREQLSRYASGNQSYTTNLDLTGNFNTGFAKHSVLLGYDYFNNYGIGGPGSSGLIPTSLLPANSVSNPYQNRHLS
jgi:iron complex outermembrane recepter protein